jgi:5-methylcytosine-specific restriction enzyme subunit McrC
MSEIPKIPIKNIYYMLCYAWNVLDQSERTDVGIEKFDNIYDLLARIYINGTNSLIKQGLNRYYKVEREAVSTLKGKLNMADSIKHQTFSKGRLVCEYDNFSENIILNQIVKKTIQILSNSPYLNEELRQKLLKQRLYFKGLEDIHFSQSLFSSLRYDRNNYQYRLLMNISELIYMGLITTEENNHISFLDFVRDKQMAKLYEKFVLNFYRHHLDGEVFNIHSPKIKWDLDEDVTKQDLSLLPEMRTDIVVENKVKHTQLIIDTKYYVKTLVSSNWTDAEKVRTGHLYQILAYVNNSNFIGRVEGILLYPTIDEEVNARFPIGGNNIWIRTLDLDAEWETVKESLVALVVR